MYRPLQSAWRSGFQCPDVRHREIRGGTGRVLAGFVPELTTGDVVITRIARVAGALTKIAAAPTRPASSVRGAFVGKDADRIRDARRLLSGETEEKFEVIAHSSDQRILLINALVYAEPTGILIDRAVMVASSSP